MRSWSKPISIRHYTRAHPLYQHYTITLLGRVKTTTRAGMLPMLLSDWTELRSNFTLPVSARLILQFYPVTVQHGVTSDLKAVGVRCQKIIIHTNFKSVVSVCRYYRYIGARGSSQLSIAARQIIGTSQPGLSSLYWRLSSLYWRLSSLYWRLCVERIVFQPIKYNGIRPRQLGTGGGYIPDPDL